MRRVNFDERSGAGVWPGLDLCTGMRRFVAEVEAVYAAVPEDQPIAAQRHTYDQVARRYSRQRPSGVRVRDTFVLAGSGLSVPIRVYEPVDRPEGPAPALLYMHGGGFALGSIESHDCVVAELALATSAVAISVDYRLAPEHPFPASFEDAYEVWRHAVNKPESLGIDPARTIVAGDSAGAALAAAICLKAISERARMPAGQLLIYPALTAMADLPSYQEQAEAPMLTSEGLAYFWNLYTEAGRHTANPFAAPLMASDLRGLPPAFVATANHDPCRDDGAVYAQRLREAGVPVEYRCAARLPHGYLRARAMSPAAAAEFAALGEGARVLMRRVRDAAEPRSAA